MVFKKKLFGSVFALIILIVIGFIIFKYQTNDHDFFRIYKTINNDSDTLLKDSLVKLDINSGVSLYLIKDTYNYIHFIMIEGSDVLLNSKVLVVNSTSNNIVEWYNKQINPKDRSVFYGILYDNLINKLVVNESEVPILNYLEYRIFFSTEKFNTPILIKGYSNDGELTYKNFN